LECLSGKREYPGPLVEAAVARLHRPPVVPRGLPGGLTGLLRWMTEDDPARRPSAREVATALRDGGEGVPNRLRGKGTTRRRALVLAGTSLAAVAIAAAAVEYADAPTAPVTANPPPAAGQPPAAAPDAPVVITEANAGKPITGPSSAERSGGAVPSADTPAPTVTVTAANSAPNTAKTKKPKTDPPGKTKTKAPKGGAGETP
jgi:hypothetical protein